MQFTIQGPVLIVAIEGTQQAAEIKHVTAALATRNAKITNVKASRGRSAVRFLFRRTMVHTRRDTRTATASIMPA